MSIRKILLFRNFPGRLSLQAVLAPGSARTHLLPPVGSADGHLLPPVLSTTVGRHRLKRPKSSPVRPQFCA